GHDAAQTLCKSKLPETADGFFSVERGKGIVAQITKSEQAAEAGDEADEIVVQFFVLRRAAELITKADSHHRGGALRITVMQEQRASGKSHDAEDAIQSLREHSLNLAADETGSREVEIGKGQHVALDTSLLFFVESHDHEHSDEGARGGGKDAHIGTLKLGSG